MNRLAVTNNHSAQTLFSVLLQSVEGNLNSIFSLLLFVNRQVNFEKELRLADVMSGNISKDPVDLGVPERLCLEEKVRAWWTRVPFSTERFRY